jgi:hypothetical protein
VTQHNHRDTCHSIRVSQPTFELDTSTVEVKSVASEAACQVDLANDWARDKYSFSLSRFRVFRDDLTWLDRTSIFISNKCIAYISHPEGGGSIFYKISVSTSKTSGHDISQDLGYTNPGCQIA